MKFFAALFVVMSLFTAADAIAGFPCNDLTNPKRFVGDMANDSMCTDNSIQSAIDWIKNNPATCPWKIFVTSEIIHSNLALNISDTGQSITFVGQGPGVVCGTTDNQLCPPEGCPPPPTNPAVTISGASGFSVLHIDGSNNITLRYLTLRGGSVSQEGGGIFDGGYGSLTLDTSVVTGNDAADGGGIAISPSGGHLDVSFANNVLVLSNTASDSGGGVHIEGDATVTVEGTGSLVGLNHAANGGGGFSLAAPARLNIGSPGYNGLGIVPGNDADYGGGIAAYATDAGNAVVKLYTTDPLHPVRVDNNFARVEGGAFYAKGHQSDNFQMAFVCAAQFRIDENAAPDGAAVYLDWDDQVLGAEESGSSLQLNTGCAGGGVRCAAGVDCNSVSDNVNQDENGNPTNGATIVVGEDSSFSANTFEMRRNRGTSLTRRYTGNYFQNADTLAACLIADNQTTGDLMDLANNPLVTVDGCTIAGNTIGGSVFDYLGTLTNTLIDQPGVNTGTAASAQYVLATEIKNLQHGTTVQTLTDAKFVDAANGDYHLRATSPAVDFAGGTGGLDLDYQPRDRDLPSVPNKFGPRDLGAYELQHACGASDTIFCDGFDVD